MKIFISTLILSLAMMINLLADNKNVKCKENNLFEKGIDKVTAPISRALDKFFNNKNPCTKVKIAKKNIKPKNTSFNNHPNKDITVYAGQFDITDQVGDDETTLLGIEHKNPNLFRNTFFGKISPITGAFVTGKSSVYLYTGVEGQYGIGPLKIKPSFAPGYYEKGDGKDLGDIIEFKSEIKFGVDLFEDSNFGYSYSHISNNDWGSTNPGTDNQTVTFSKNF